MHGACHTDLQEPIARFRSERLVRKADLLEEIEVVSALRNRYVENLETIASHARPPRPIPSRVFLGDRGRRAAGKDYARVVPLSSAMPMSKIAPLRLTAMRRRRDACGTTTPVPRSPMRLHR
ncbi:hypothetical protein CFB49_17275 [Burkholderia sp. AU17457]|nr:hypothetical protein CFB49_17275 [Burkholderia sp. AU17457]